MAFLASISVVARPRGSQAPWFRSVWARALAVAESSAHLPSPFVREGPADVIVRRGLRLQRLLDVATDDEAENVGGVVAPDATADAEHDGIVVVMTDVGHGPTPFESGSPYISEPLS